MKKHKFEDFEYSVRFRWLDVNQGDVPDLLIHVYTESGGRKFLKTSGIVNLNKEVDLSEAIINQTLLWKEVAHQVQKSIREIEQDKEYYCKNPKSVV